MKNVKINHEFTLKEILECIKSDGDVHSDYVPAYKAMYKKIKFFLEMIE